MINYLINEFIICKTIFLNCFNLCTLLLICLLYLYDVFMCLSCVSVLLLCNQLPFWDQIKHELIDNKLSNCQLVLCPFVHLLILILLVLHSSQCSVDCGVGRRTRSVRCVSDQGSIVNDKECNSRARPQGSEECNMGPCVTNWYFTNWSHTVSDTHAPKQRNKHSQHLTVILNMISHFVHQCSAQCGPGVQRREVVCLTQGGVREGGGGGDCVGEKPAEMKACNGGPCVPTTMWYSSPWTQVGWTKRLKYREWRRNRFEG